MTLHRTSLSCSFGLLLGAVLLCVGALPLHAQTANRTSDPAATWTAASGFGQALAVSDDQVFVGEPSNVHAPGRVVVYANSDDGWTESARLTADSPAVGDGFGAALALDGTRLAVGAPASDAVYIFESDGSEWTQTARVGEPDVGAGQFGEHVALAGDRLVASVTDPPFTFKPGRGGVVVFERDADGAWTRVQTLLPDDVQAGDGFGESVALVGGDLLVGAPGARGAGGAVHVFRPGDDATWTRAQVLEGDGGRFGFSLAGVEAAEAMVLVGAPFAGGRTGAVPVAHRDAESNAWRIVETLTPSQDVQDAGFGVALSVAASDDGLTAWIGAPGASEQSGAIVRASHSASTGTWTVAQRLTHPDVTAGDRLGRTVAASGAVVAAGVPGDDYGANMSGASAVALYDVARASWMASPLTPPPVQALTQVRGEPVPCSDGEAQTFTCEGVDLLSFLPIEALGGARGVRVNDVWGWTDPETKREYALVGRVDGTAFVDVTDPTQPVYVGELPKTDGSEAKIWRDVKVYRDHAFVVADNAGEHGMQVFDLTQLRDVAPDERPKTFDASARYDVIHSAHNVFINEDTGFAYVVGSNGGGQTCGGGLHMVNVQDPLQPTFAGCFADPSTGLTGTGSTHDTQCVVYAGPDAEHQGKEICFSSNETAVSIADVSDKDAPTSISTASHPRTAYVHQGWLTEDQRYLYVNDELDEMNGLVDRTRTLVWDVSDLDDPQLVTEFFLSTAASDHNLYVRGTTMYQSNYTSGLRIVDVTDPENPVETGHFDTLPFGADRPGFEGSFSNYPFFESGVVVVTSMQEGLFVVKKAQTEM